MAQDVEAGTPILLADGGTGIVSLRPGNLFGFYVNSTTSGTIILKDGGTSGTAVSGTITPAIGFHRFPAYFPTSCFATIGGTLSVTFFFAAG